MAGDQTPFLQFADWSLYLLSYLKPLFSQRIAETEVHICFKGGRYSQRVGGLQMNCRTLRIILSEIQTKLREAAAAQRCAAVCSTACFNVREGLTGREECFGESHVWCGRDGLHSTSTMFSWQLPPTVCPLLCTKVRPYVHTSVMFHSDYQSLDPISTVRQRKREV